MKQHWWLDEPSEHEDLEALIVGIVGAAILFIILNVLGR